MASRYRFDKAAAAAIKNYSSQHASSVHWEAATVRVTRTRYISKLGARWASTNRFWPTAHVVEGSGWVRAGSNAHQVGGGDVVRLERGEIHAKGSETGMTAVMVQMSTSTDAPRLGVPASGNG